MWGPVENFSTTSRGLLNDNNIVISGDYQNGSYFLLPHYHPYAIYEIRKLDTTLQINGCLCLNIFGTESYQPWKEAKWNYNQQYVIQALYILYGYML